jgi:hypothetical protein
MFPESFGYLRDSAIHSAERAWTALGHFFVCQSILALAWAAIYAAPDNKIGAREWVLITISLAGIAMGLQWSLLGTRMWQYHLEYGERLADLYKGFTEDTHGAGARAWADIDRFIYDYWRSDRPLAQVLKWSGNQWVLFSAPLFLSAVHLVMLMVVLWLISTYAAIGAATVCCIGFAIVWKICEPALSKAPFRP